MRNFAFIFFAISSQFSHILPLFFHIFSSSFHLAVPLQCSVQQADRPRLRPRLCSQSRQLIEIPRHRLAWFADRYRRWPLPPAPHRSTPHAPRGGHSAHDSRTPFLVHRHLLCLYKKLSVTVAMQYGSSGRLAQLDSTIAWKLVTRRRTTRQRVHVTSELFLTLPRGYSTPLSRWRSASS